MICLNFKKSTKLLGLLNKNQDIYIKNCKTVITMLYLSHSSSYIWCKKYTSKCNYYYMTEVVNYKY